MKKKKKNLLGFGKIPFRVVILVLTTNNKYNNNNKNNNNQSINKLDYL